MNSYNLLKIIVTASSLATTPFIHADNLSFNLSTLKSITASTATLVCKTPASRFAQCPANTNPTLVGQINQQIINFSLSAIQHTAFPSDSRCPVDSLQCELDVNGQAINQVQLSNIVRVPCGKSVCWAMSDMQVTPSDDNTVADFTTKTNQVPYAQFNHYYQDWSDSAYPITAGFINLTGNVATPPAILQCGNQTINSIPRNGGSSFPIRSLFNNTDPTQDATATNCLLKDSSPNSPIYAVFNKIDQIDAETTQSSHSLSWVSDVEKFNYGNTNYLVSLPVGSNPAQLHPDAFNEWNMSIQTIGDGNIQFAGIPATVAANTLQLSCDQHSPIALDKNYSIPLSALHNPNDAINTPNNFQSCQVSSQDGQTVYLNFGLFNLVGNFITEDQKANWTATITAPKTVTAQFNINPSVTPTNCYAQLNNQCANWNITLTQAK